MRFSVTPISTLLFLLSPWAFADGSSDAQAVFQKMVTVSPRLNYQGRFVYLRNGKMDTMHVLHSHDGTQEYERLVALNGMSWTVVREGDQVFCAFPGATEKRLQHSKLRMLTSLKPKYKLAALRQHYSIRTVRVDRLADRRSQVIAIDPKDQYRYGYRLWIDLDSGILLRSDVMSADQKILEQMMFTSIKIYKDAKELNLAFKGGMYSSPRFTKTDSGAAQLALNSQMADLPSPGPRQILWWADLPPGFFLAEQDSGTPPDRVEHIVYTDGLASISVFIEKQPVSSNTQQALPADELVSRGAIHALALIKKPIGRQITFVGEVPQATLRKIADSWRKIGQ